jgi:hypothetical protein
MKFGLHYLLSVSESQSASQRYRDTAATQRVTWITAALAAE